MTIYVRFFYIAILLACLHTSLFASQAFSFQYAIKPEFFHQIYQSYKKKYQVHPDENTGYVSAMLTIFELSEELIKKQDYYSEIVYFPQKSQLTLTASITNSIGEVGYCKVSFYDIKSNEWQKLQTYVTKHQDNQLNEYIKEIIYNKPVKDLDFELHISRELPTTKLIKILPVLTQMSETEQNINYPADIYLRLIYDKDSTELVTDATLSYSERAEINLYLRSFTQGDLFFNNPWENQHRVDNFIVNPELLTLTVTNDTLVQDIIKAHLGWDNDLVSAIARKNISSKINKIAGSASTEYARDYYKSLAYFIENPQSIKIVVQSHTRNPDGLNGFWKNINEVIRYQSMLDSIPSGELGQTAEAQIKRKFSNKYLDSSLENLTAYMDKGILVRYLVNGQEINN